MSRVQELFIRILIGEPTEELPYVEVALCGHPLLRD
jgi:hypothetical protein